MVHYNYEPWSDETLHNAIHRVVDHLYDRPLYELSSDTTATVETVAIDQLLGDPDSNVRPGTEIVYRLYDTEITVAVETEELIRITGERL